MTTTTISLWQPWPRRLRDALARRLARFGAQLAEHRRIDRELRELAEAASLDPRMLRDVGLPDWARDEAARRGQAIDARRAATLGDGAAGVRFY